MLINFWDSFIYSIFLLEVMPIHNYLNAKGLFSRELFEIYFMLAFRKLAIAMVGIFLPLYFLVELEYSFNFVLFFFLVYSFVFTLCLYPALKIVERWGTKHAMLFSMPLLFFGMVGSMGISDYPVLFFPAAALLGADMAFFWMGCHTDAALHSKKKTVGKESAMLWMVRLLGVVVGPVFGGILVVNYGFTVLFSVVAAIIVIAGIPLLSSKEVYVKAKFRFANLMKGGHLKYAFGYFAQGLQLMALAVFWPIFIYYILGDYLSLGVYATVASLFVGVFGYFLGDWTDQKSKSWIIKIFAPFEALFWFIRSLLSTTVGVFTIGTLGAVSRLGIDVPLLAKTYMRAKKEEIVGFILWRELCIRAGQVFLLLVMFALGDPVYAFYVASAASLLYFLF
jgi:MFS family permease